MQKLEIASDNWFQNILRIYEQRKDNIKLLSSTSIDQTIWAYPIFARAFYNSFNHKIGNFFVD